MKAKMGLSGIKTCDGKDAEFSGFDLNIDQSELMFGRINNTDDKDEVFGGLDLNIAHSDLGFADDRDEVFGGFDINIAQTELGFSEINNFDEKEEFGDMNLDIAQNDFGYPRTNKLDEKDKVLCSMDDEKIDLSSENFVKTVDIKRNDDTITKLSRMNKLGSQSKNNTVILSKNVKTVGRPRKPLSSSKMLEWLANAARNPHDLTFGSIPRISKWKKYKGNQVWKQILLVKESLFAKQNVDSGNKLDCLQKKRHMMHPSMYEDDKIPIHLSSKRIRCSQRVSSVKSCSCPGCTSSQNKRVKKTQQIMETIKTQDDVCEDLDTESESDIVRAEVPEWSGVVSESDPKWLGTRMWPSLEDNNRIHQMDNVVIGKGRQSSCACLNRGSADCVRFHIAENRTKVKHTLGPLFYKWKFDHMGEEALVSSWSLEEESEFKSLVIKARQELTDKTKSRHEIMSNFWRRASQSIPSKTKDVLVSYYFNVFVLRRRSYQNRINPDNIDSDDDEQELGCEKIHTLYVKCRGTE